MLTHHSIQPVSTGFDIDQVELDRLEKMVPQEGHVGIISYDIYQM